MAIFIDLDDSRSAPRFTRAPLCPSAFVYHAYVQPFLTGMDCEIFVSDVKSLIFQGHSACQLAIRVDKVASSEACTSWLRCTKLWLTLICRSICADFERYTV